MASVTLTRPARAVKAYVKNKANKPAAGINPYPPLPSPLGGEGGGGITQTSRRVKVEVKEESRHVDLATLLSLADQLNPADKKQLLATLALKSQGSTRSDNRDLEMWSVAVYEGLQATIGTEGGGLAGAAAVKRTLSVPACWQPVVNFMRTSKLDQLNVTDRQSVYLLLANLVIEKASYVARQGGAPLSAKLVGNYSTHLASIFDQAFPGYLAAGLAPLVAKQLVRSKGHLT